MLMFDEYKALIQTASERVYDVAVRTSLDFAPVLSERTGNRIWLKREDEQPCFHTNYVVRTT